MVAVAQGDVEAVGQLEHHAGTGARAAGLDEAQMASRYAGVGRQVHLAQAPLPTPLAQQRADGRRGARAGHGGFDLAPRRQRDAYLERKDLTSVSPGALLASWRCPPPPGRARAGGRYGGFAPTDWGLVATVAVLWGASFLFIELGLEHLSPPVVAFARVFFGATALVLLPAARRSVPRSEWAPIALLGVILDNDPVPAVRCGPAVDRVVAGRNDQRGRAAVHGTRSRRCRPAAARPHAGGRTSHRLPRRGRDHVSLDRRGRVHGLGIALVLAATFLYGCAFNLLGPLQRRNGALPVILRAQAVALVLLAPAAAVGATDSEFAWSSLAAMVARARSEPGWPSWPSPR